jgi:hypothetical protein
LRRSNAAENLELDEADVDEADINGAADIEKRDD